jgi:succinate--hydroxymethylglutarate CoA-transferase
LAEILQTHFSKRTAAEWLEEFDRRGVPSAPINEFAEVLADRHVVERGWLSQMELPNGVVTPTVGNPVSITGYQFSIEAMPPRLGEHTAAVRAEWLS